MQVKAWINRIGLVAIIVGIVGLTTAGFDPGAAIESGYAWAGIAGTVLVAIKEIIQTLQK